jgi:hypothetical protein
MPVSSIFIVANSAWVLGMLLLVNSSLFLFCQRLTWFPSYVPPGPFVERVVHIDEVAAIVAVLLVGIPGSVPPLHFCAPFAEIYEVALVLAFGILEHYNGLHFFLLLGRLVLATMLE